MKKVSGFDYLFKRGDVYYYKRRVWDGFQSIVHDTERRDWATTKYVRKRRPNAHWTRKQVHNGIALYANDFGKVGLKLVCYAKLHNRIRFEVRFQPTMRNIFQSSRIFDIGYYLPDILELFNRYIDNSRKRLAKFLTALPDLAQTERSQYHVFADFLNIMANVHREYPRVNLRDTFSQLANTGRYIANQGSNIHAVMELLVEERIVRRGQALLRDDGNQTIYHLTPRYHQIMSGMREIFLSGEEE